jgi:hypothetical protein
MRLLKRFACDVVGHDPTYSQILVIRDGKLNWQRNECCAYCGSTRSREIHTPGLLDLPAWMLLCADALRFGLPDWYRKNLRSLAQLFRKRAN